MQWSGWSVRHTPSPGVRERASASEERKGMRHRRSEQPTLFELAACNEVAPLRGLSPEHAVPKVTPQSERSVPEGDIAPRERQAFRAVSPLATMALHEVCAACSREISGSGFVILDYEELGAFCDQDCGDKRFRSYLREAPEERIF